MDLLKRMTALVLVTLALGTAGCGEDSSDEAITGRVRTAISDEPGLKGTKVSVSTNEQVVHLSGTVKSRAERAMLISAARNVDGVKAVKTDLVVAAQQAPAARAQQAPAARAQQKPAVKTRVTKARPQPDRPTSIY
jgi:hypothetical protein